MIKERYLMRRMKREELAIAIDWAGKEGWNPGLYDDAACFWAQDPRGFFIGLLDDKPIATVSAVRYGNSYGFMGFYIVKKEFRGKGYGIKLFNKAWDYLGERNKGGDGVLENLEKYAKVGLKLAHLNARYQGFGSGTKKVESGVIKLSKIPFNQLTKFDDEVFGFPGHKFLKLWISRPKTKALGFIKKGKLQGYGVIRKCFKGYKIGPLFADSDAIAKKLFHSLLGRVDKKTEVFFDPPESNSFAVKLAKDYQMKKVFATGRIYTKGQPKFPLERWFGVTSFELG